MTANDSRKSHTPVGLGNIAHHSIGEFCHDFRGQLTVIKEFASIIVDGYGGPVSPEQEEYLKTIMAAVDKIVQMVDDLSKQYGPSNGFPSDRLTARYPIGAEQDRRI